jgi:DNA replication protein DnaC
VAKILAEVGNVVVSHGIQKLSQSFADGLGLVDPYEQVKHDRSMLQLMAIEARIARAERQEAQAAAMAEELRLRQQKQDLLNEKQRRLYDLKIQEKELEIERARNNLTTNIGQRTEIDLHIRTEPISGALEVTANPEGLTGAKEQQQAYYEWLDSLESGKVVLILGKRGSGKSALAAKIAEYMMGVHRMATYWIGLPDKAREVLPHWIKIVDDPGKCPMNSFLLCDEAGVN